MLEDRLAEAIRRHRTAVTQGVPFNLFGHVCFGNCAKSIKAMYDLIEEEEDRVPCPHCPHWKALHNPDGSCPCGASHPKEQAA